MKALLKTKREQGIWMGEVPIPEIGPNDVLIRIHKSAICGTDVHIYNWDEWAQKTIPVPMVVGHEYVGVIEKVGDEVEGYHPGDRVSGEGHITCGHCRNCRAGKRHLCRNTVGVGVNRPGPLRSTSASRPSTCSRCRTTSRMRRPPSLILTGTPPIRPSASTWWARTC